MRRLPDLAYRFIGRFSVTRFDRVVHPLLYRWSGGRGILGRILGCDTILLSTRGRRSGRIRTVALFAFPIETGWAVVGSRGGSGRIPAWYRNLEAEPAALVEVRDRAVPVVARSADGDEYERLFELAAVSYPGYRTYRAAADHRIPIVALEHASATPGSGDAVPAAEAADPGSPEPGTGPEPGAA
jgi:deazaflavin-dependent oxidoreductase (nitroreductase family)